MEEVWRVLVVIPHQNHDSWDCNSQYFCDEMKSMLLLEWEYLFFQWNGYNLNNNRWLRSWVTCMPTLLTFQFPITFSLSFYFFFFFFFNLFAINLWLYLLYISLLHHYPIYIWWDILLKVKIICLNFISLSFLFGYLNVKERTCYGEITWSLLQKFLSCNLLGFHDNNSNYYYKKFDIMIKYIDIRKKNAWFGFVWIWRLGCWWIIRGDWIGKGKKIIFIIWVFWTDLAD